MRISTTKRTFLIIGAAMCFLSLQYALAMTLQGSRLKCLETTLKEQQASIEYQQVSHSVVDTINRWSAMGVTGVAGLRHSLWKVDAVLFNSKRDKCLILVPSIDQREGVKLDDIQMLAGELVDGQWRYYVTGMPTMIMYKPKKPTTDSLWFEELSKYSRWQVARGGYLKKGTCEINDSYVDDWFTSDLYRLHEEVVQSLRP